MSDRSAHDDDHELSAAYVLGALAADERARFEQHLDGCERCQSDVVQFAPIPGLLRQVAASELAGAPIDVADGVVDGVRRQRSRSLRRRERRLVAVAAVSLLVAVGAVLVAVLGDDGGPPTFGGPPIELAIDDSSGVTGRVVINERSWGTRVEIDLFDVPARDRYLLWAVGRDGTWDVSASWGLSDEGTCRVVGASRLYPAEIDRFVVTSEDPADELVSAFSS